MYKFSGISHLWIKGLQNIRLKANGSGNGDHAQVTNAMFPWTSVTGKDLSFKRKKIQPIKIWYSNSARPKPIRKTHKTMAMKKEIHLFFMCHLKGVALVVDFIKYQRSFGS